MGRRGAASHLENRLGTLRLARGLSQQQLALQAGLTRQAVNSIEHGHYVPNAIVALRLAQVLQVTVEELFVLPPLDPTPQLDVLVHGSADPHRLAVGYVGEQWVGYPLTAGWDLQPGFPSADVLTRADQTRVVASGTVPIGALPPGDYVVRGIVRLESGETGRVIRTLRKLPK